ncbi:UNVERIFIED_CONTAM: hypothetical protein GTU68_017741 [Idotea baltica]|nr:hypothetical protein [Idotea baltica]
MTALDAKVVTRFAPSPTGYLHIGGARTALFNWLFARHHGGKFLLRIEDTDRARSTPEATEAIYAGMKWLGLDWDGDAVSQFARIDRHAEAASLMLENGSAYRSPYAVRLKAPRDGETVVDDQVQGRVTWSNDQLDDLILLRSDGVPTYMLAVVVDDHEMGVTHVIRGDDHLTNAARQTLIYKGLGWDTPVFAHIPLIHGPDGAKLSKRHGALGVEEYQAMGYLPEAMRNYLARLSWAHGDEEFFTTEQAIEWFGLEAVGKSAARFDFQKLENLNGQHMRAASDERLTEACASRFAVREGRALSDTEKGKLLEAMPGLKERAKTTNELLDVAGYIFSERPLSFEPKAEKLLDDDARAMLGELTSHMREARDWSTEELETITKAFAEERATKLGKIAQPLRAALTGRTISPGIYDVMVTLGRDETLARLDDLRSA